MRVIAGDKTYDFDPEKFMAVELAAVEKATGLNALSFQNGLAEGSYLAAIGLIWILERRQGYRGGYDSIDFPATTFLLSADGDDEAKLSERGVSSDTTPGPVLSPQPVSTTTPSDFLPVGV